MGFLSDFVDGITGRGQAEAAKDAGKFQYEAAKEAREQLERLNEPYLQLGEESIPQYQGILQDPRYNTFETLQADPYGAGYLSNNPLFQASVDNAARQLKGTAAAKGKYNSGGLVDALFQNYLATGDQYWGNYLQRSDALGSSAYNRAYLPVQMGQNAATFQGTQAGNLITGGAAARAAGEVGSANALSGGANNLIGLGSSLFSFGSGRGWW